MHITVGFVLMGLDVVNSTMCRHQLQFEHYEQHQAIEQTMNFNL